MTSRWIPVAASLVLLAACGTPPGRPAKGSQALAPNEVVEFRALYAANCAGCHGRQGRGGAAIVHRKRGVTGDLLRGER